MKKIILSLFVCVFLIGVVSSACVEGEGYLGNKEYNSCVRISQTCASCTYVNVSSIILSTSNETLDSNVAMINFGNGEWIYQFCQTQAFGNYNIVGKGDVDGVDTSFTSCFDVGQNLSTGEAIIYLMLLGSICLVFLIMVYFIIILPNENESDDNGMVIGVVRLKYLRIALIMISYPALAIILNLMNGLAVNFASLDIFSGTIGFIFEMMMRASWIFTFVMILWILYLLVKDSNVSANIKKLGNMRF